jgi:GntR family transcriptional regulator/MocR family aminotransferase
MANQFECHRHTVMTAISELISEGWIVARERQGYFVVDRLPDQFFQDVVSPAPNISEKRFDWHLTVTPIELSQSIEDNIKYNFQSGIADYSLFPFIEFNSCFSEALRTRDKNKFRYGNHLGVPELIDALSVYLRRIRGISDRDIVVTHGSQE